MADCLTQCYRQPAAVAMEFRVTCLPPEVPVMLSRNGAVIPLTFSVNCIYCR